MEALAATVSTLGVTQAPASFSVPLSDTLEFASLPETRRNEISVYLRLMERVHSLCSETSLHQACIVVASTSQHLLRGCAASSLRRKYTAYVDAGNDWRVLQRHYKGPAANLPVAFTDYAKAMAEDNHRSMAAAFAMIRDLWRKGHPIPGYGTWAEHYMRVYPERAMPKHCPTSFLPDGWSDRTLYRHAPSKGARALKQRGFAAGKRFFPSITRDTSALKPLEMIAIDDFELDCLCVFHGDRENKPQIGRVAGLLAIDVATRRKLHWGIGQRMERSEEQPDGTIKTVRTGISRVDVLRLLHGLFEKFGLPPYTVTIVCENAAASISPELELSLSTLFDGRVRVERTGLIQHRTLSNGFVEKGGRPWDKGWIEAAFNALWNHLGSMPGYKGNNARINAPADLDAKVALTKVFLGQGERALNLPPEQIALLRMPFPSIETLERAFAWACAMVDTNTNHRYIGFERVTDYFLAEGTDPVSFTALATLTPEQQLQVTMVERMESSLERWGRISTGIVFQRVPSSVLTLLLMVPKKVVYRNHAIYFQHGREGFTYVDRDGKILGSVQEGTELLGYFDQANPGELHLADLRGAYMGTLPRLGGKTGRVDIRDKEAISEAGAVVRTLVNREISEIRKRHASEDAQLVADRMHNQAVIEAHQATLADRPKAEALAEAVGQRVAQQIMESAQNKALAKAGNLDATKLF